MVTEKFQRNGEIFKEKERLGNFFSPGFSSFLLGASGRVKFGRGEFFKVR